MAITIDFGSKIISVLKTDMVLVQSVPSEIYELDMDVFRLEMKDLEDTEDGMAVTDTHLHNPPVTVSGAVLARVVEILDPFTVTFEDGQYRVSVVGANTNIGERINVNQVSVSTSNSAGLQDLNSLQAASFEGGVTVDTSSSYAGVVYPIGTRAQPVNNMLDAVTIATTRGLAKIYVAKDLTLTSADVSKGFEFIGNSTVTVTLTLEDAALVSNCTFRDLTIQGILDNGNFIKDCTVLDLINVNGSMENCALAGTITMGGSLQSTMHTCYSNFAGGNAEDTAIIDMGGGGQPLVLRDYTGGITLINKTGPESISIDMASGHIVLDQTVINGSITCRGLGKLTDRSVGANVNSDDLINKALITEITDLVNELKQSTPSRQEITKAVWSADLIDMDDEETAGYHLLNTAEIVENNVRSTAELTAAIWDETATDHVTVGSVGESLNNASNGSNPATIADAIWDKDMTGEFTAGSAGSILQKIKLIFKIMLS